jgi:hypothetical protein
MPLSVLAVSKQMSAKRLRTILQAANVTMFCLGGSWQVSEREFQAFEERLAAEARQARQGVCQ